MDGVLVDVTESYRATIQATVKHFTGDEPSREEIQDWKNRGGWNDDWQLSHRMIQERGGSTPYDEVVDYFQKLFHGDGTNGLILREQWLASNGLFDRLGRTSSSCRLHRPPALGSERHSRPFPAESLRPVVGTDDVARTKPDPEGIHKIRAAVAHGKCWYIGDTVDDARAASAAGVPFIGIAARANPRYDELVRLLRDRRRGRRARRHQLTGGRSCPVRTAETSARHQRDADRRRTAHRRPRPLRNLDRHPLPRSHAGAVRQARRLRSEAPRRRAISTSTSTTPWKTSAS